MNGKERRQESGVRIKKTEVRSQKKEGKTRRGSEIPSPWFLLSTFNSQLSTAFLSRRRPTLPQGSPCSTMGPGGLNYRVRDGNGCDPSGKIAGKLENRCQVSGLRCRGKAPKPGPWNPEPALLIVRCLARGARGLGIRDSGRTAELKNNSALPLPNP